MTLSWIRLTLPLSVALLPAACTPPPTEATSTSDGASSSSSEGPGPSTTPGTTLPGEDTMGTQGATGTDTTMGAVDTTAGTSVGTEDTTMGVEPTAGSDSTTGEPPPPECMGDEECANNQICDAGMCVDACGGAWGAGSFAYCLTPIGGFDSATICGEALSCLNEGDPIEVVVCARSCGSPCECPAPPPTGNATVTCADITTADGNECYLSCANNETCPEGMVCRPDDFGNPLYCTHPVQPQPMYGNCANVATTCLEGACATASNGMNTWSVCVSVCDGGIGECDAAPPGAVLGTSCEGIIFPPDGSDCHLDCNNNTDCPIGMTCIDLGDDNLCMWPN